MADKNVEAILQQLADSQKQLQDLIATTTAAKSQPSSTPVIPKFEHDPAEAHSAALWFDRLTSIYRTLSLTNEQKVAYAVAALDTSTYKRVARALLPKKLSSLTDITDLEAKMVELFDRKESLFAKRYAHFQMEWKGPEHESVPEFFARIRESTAAIEPAKLDENAIQTLTAIMSMKHPALEGFRIQLLNMLNKDPATKLDACETAIMASLQTQREQKLPMGVSVNYVKKINGNRPKSKPAAGEKKMTCFRCGQPHSPDTCKFIKAVCHYCKKTGHLEKVCKTKQHNSNSRNYGSKSSSIRQPSVKYVTTADSSAASSTFGPTIRGSSNIRLLSIRTNKPAASASPSNRIMLKVLINDTPVTAQLDSGSDATIVSQEEYERIGKPAFTGPKLSARTANDTLLPFIGSFECLVTLNERTERLMIHVANTTVSLLGLDFYHAFGLEEVPLKSITCNLVVSNSAAPPGAVDSLMKEFEPLFKEGLGKCTKAEVVLQLKKDATPFFCGARRLSLHGTEILKSVIEQNVAADVMYKVDYSQYASPCSLIPRKDGRHRLVVDYSTGLNDRLVEPCYTLPLPEDIFAKLSGCTVFSTLDFSDAYHQVGLSKESQKYTTIATPFGLYRYKRLSQGLKTAVSDFQEVAELMLNDVDAASPYLDDVIVASCGSDQHMDDLRKTLSSINEWGFRLNPKKCKFFCTQIRFLGRLIDANGIRPDPDKVAAIQKMPDPSDVSTLRSFLGMVNYYQHFIPCFRDLRESLDDLLKDNIAWEWTEEHRKAAAIIRKKLADECLLTHYDPRLPLIVAADASQNGIGGVISHVYPDGKEKPIQFFSRALDSTQRKYSQTDKEALALVTAVKLFHRYLEGQHVTLQTDHKALLSLFGNKKGLPVLAANRLHRWAIFLAAYKFDIKYKKTTEFRQADAVSRLIHRTRELPELFEEEDDLDDTVFSEIAVKQLSTLPVNATEVVNAYEEDDFAQNILRSLANGTSDSKYSLVNDIIMMNNRVYIPAALRSRVLEQLHAGHSGITLTKQLARQHVYWPGITRDIEKKISSCFSCIQLSKMPVKSTLASWSVALNPGDRIHIDFAGPVSVSDNGRQFTSNEFAQFCEKYGIKHIRSPVYHPQSNGQAERAVDIVKRFISKTAAEHGELADLKELIDQFLLNNRTTPSTATPGHTSPAFAHIGRELRTTLDLLRPYSLQTSGPDIKMEQQFNHQHGARMRNFDIDDRVHARTNKDKPWFEGVIQKRLGKKLYIILDNNGFSHRLHENQLIKRALIVPDDENFPAASNPSTPIGSPRRSLSPALVPELQSSPARSPAPTPVPQQSLAPQRPIRDRRQTKFLQPDPRKKTYN
uniref:RNA-directed DNA polymerase n=1 Tax=Panagrolaimus davidi TaxID=227884 RepID=A0A914QPJ1_9BILA